MRESYREDLRQVKQITTSATSASMRFSTTRSGSTAKTSKAMRFTTSTTWTRSTTGCGQRGQAFHRDELHAQTVGGAPRLPSFWYKPIVSPPADYAKWNALIRAFAQHLIDRYGIDEVASWYFEVWNEPNIDFWTGRPAQETYFELYDNTARALKAVNQRIRVGGPATAQAAWVDAIIAHTAKENVPLDFVSTHAYGNETAADILGHPADIAPTRCFRRGR